ncbi:MAG: trypsin-like serine protease [Ruminococcaceae bacterium]|nr:trypsin-like serine protease [Oscillospiraceae bacterium]
MKITCSQCGGNFDADKSNYICPYCTGDNSDKKAAVAAVTAAAAAPSVTAPQKSNVLTGEEIYENAIRGIVEIYALTNAGDGVMSASGFIVSDSGFVLTNAHAVLDEDGRLCKTIQVKAMEKFYPALVVALGKPADGKNDSIDLCLLYVKGFNVKPNNIGDVSKLKNGQRVYLIGNSLGSGTCITSGIISDKERAMPGLSYPYIMTDAAANHGNSGGPLYNEMGEVIGVLVAGIDGAKGMNYAIPANVAESFLSYVVNNTDMKRLPIGDLKRYAKSSSNYSAMTLPLAITGIKLILDVIEYIASLFGKK